MMLISSIVQYAKWICVCLIDMKMNIIASRFCKQKHMKRLRNRTLDSTGEAAKRRPLRRKSQNLEAKNYPSVTRLQDSSYAVEGIPKIKMTSKRIELHLPRRHPNLLEVLVLVQV